MVRIVQIVSMFKSRSNRSGSRLSTRSGLHQSVFDFIRKCVCFVRTSSVLHCHSDLTGQKETHWEGDLHRVLKIQCWFFITFRYYTPRLLPFVIDAEFLRTFSVNYALIPASVTCDDAVLSRLVF